MDPHALTMRHSSQDPNWRTPTQFIGTLRTIFPLQVDLAADLDSAVILDSGGLAHYFGPDHPVKEYQNSLDVNWSETGYTCGFLNPPYSITRIKELRAHYTQLSAGANEWQLKEMKEVYEKHVRTFRIESWAEKAYHESLKGFTTIGVFPYAPQTKWFRHYVMGQYPGDMSHAVGGWTGHAALDYWRLPHRVPFLRADGSKAGGANVNTCVIIWGPNPGFVGPWTPSGRYWSYRQPTVEKEPA